MNIAINMYLSTLKQRTGIGNYAYNLMKALSEIVAVKNDDKLYSYAHGKLFQNLDIENTSSNNIVNLILKFLPSKYLYAIPFYIPIREKILQILNKSKNKQNLFSDYKIDIYHEPNFLLEVNENNTNNNTNNNIKTIITVHDLSIFDVPETHPKHRVEFVTKNLEKSLNKADKIICDSEFTKQRLLHYFPQTKSKSKVIYLGVENKFMPLANLLKADEANHKENANNIFLQQYNLKSQSYILSVGTLEPRKNILTLINAFLQLPNNLQQKFPLVIIGQRGWLDDNIINKINALVNQQKLYFLNYVSDTDLIRLYANAKVFCYPSIYEGFGLPPLEAMASGIPVITSNSSSIPEVVGENSLMHESQDDFQLKQHLYNVLNDENLHKQLSEYSLNRSKLFSWNKTAEQTLQVYKE